LKDFQLRVKENGGKISPKDFKKQLYGIHYWNNQNKTEIPSSKQSSRAAAETTHHKNASSIDQKHPVFTMTSAPINETKKPILSTLVLDLEKEDLRHRAQGKYDKPLQSPPAVLKQVSILMSQTKTTTTAAKEEATTPTIMAV